MASEIAHGARTSLLVGVGATLAAIVFGVIVGGLSGYYRGPVEVALMRLTEFFQTIPSFVLAILIVAIPLTLHHHRDLRHRRRILARHRPPGARRVRVAERA